MVQSTYNDSEKTLLIAFSGKMDTVNSREVEGLLPEHYAKAPLPGGTKLTFDLAEVDFMASSFIRLCITAAKKADKGMFEIINTQPQVKKTFVMSKLDTVLNVS